MANKPTEKKLTPKQQCFVDEYLIDVDRFWSYVDKSNGPDACWLWQGALNNGYGAFHVGLSRNAVKLAHRIAFGLSTGETPEAVCHKCDTPKCCNPGHLFGGTRGDNNRDMVKKDRHAKKKPPLQGENHHQAKLTNDDVVNIRGIYEAGGISQYQLADIYGVCQRTINKAVRGIGFENIR